MVLKRKAPADFEQMEQDTATAEAQEAQAEAASPQPAAASQTSAVVTAPRAALATKPVPTADINYVKNLKNTHTVQYDSLPQIQATQGNFIDRETSKSLGSEVILEILSYQDQYVVTPNDDKAPKEHVRYSVDKLTCSDGTTVEDHLAFLKELGYANARVNARYIVVAAVNAAEKTDSFDGSLIQLDLSPKSKAQWDRYLIQSAYDLAKGKITEAQSVVVDARTELAKNGDNTYTIVKFATHAD